eukprot:TRINITY_DN10774_c0_g1_i1.p2 TRINITY_DN10774_c0_g1~~TRINITY_DN10774_c0_g1_i1.p2  ORF type:complete len:190 (+),score=42.03 TRINITY_DN10774_c0_g1_i1:168-737(+)
MQMQEDIEVLASHLLERSRGCSPGQKYLVGIAGGPGAGKTTTAKRLAEVLNSAQPGVAVCLGMDGYHFYRHQLDKFPDPADAHRRRGAPHTFDVQRFLQLLKTIRVDGTAKAPSFDHRLKDPVEDDISILPSHRIVILEGNYLLLDRDEWRDVAPLLDERVFLDCDADVAMERVVLRHIDQLGAQTTCH